MVLLDGKEKNWCGQKLYKSKNGKTQIELVNLGWFCTNFNFEMCELFFK